RLHRTPLLTSATLSKKIGADVRFKAELFQRTGAFKPRGVLNKLATLTDEEKSRGVISISAGNHAQALAYASAVEGIDALVVMWKTASPMKIVAARGYGATIDTEAAEAEVVLVQVGGGGLVSGIATAVKAMKPDVRVIAIEPERSRALHESLKAGEPVTVEAKSIADGLNGPYAGANCVRVCTELGVESVLVTEQALEEAFRFMYGRMKLACEVAGAATAAALLSGAFVPEPGQTVASVVSGGNVAAKTAAAILNADEA